MTATQKKETEDPSKHMRTAHTMSNCTLRDVRGDELVHRPIPHSIRSTILPPVAQHSLTLSGPRGGGEMG